MKMNMNAMRKQALDLLESLWQFQYRGGGFRHSPDGYVSVMGTTDAAWIFQMLRADTQIANFRQEAAEWLLAQQQTDGHYHHDMPRFNSSEYRHSDGHALWMTARALRIYGSALPDVPTYLKPLADPKKLEEWFAATDWQSAESNHHDVLSLIPVAGWVQDPEWSRVYYENLEKQQDPVTHTWCNNREHRTNVSRTFAYVALFRAAGKIPPYAKELIDNILSIQRDSGIWETRCDTPEFHTMDAVYILKRLGDAIGYPEEPRLRAMERAADAMAVYFASRPIERFTDTHLLHGNLQTIGLLQEAFPERYETDIPWHFEWDHADQFYAK